MPSPPRYRGIPPSLDRIRFRRNVALVAGACLVLALGGLLLAARDLSSRLTPGGAPVPAVVDVPQPADPEEAERASAYAAVQHFIHEQVQTEPEIRTVYFRGNRHEVIQGVYRFIGEIDVEYLGGTVQRLTYEAAVYRGLDEAWRLDSLRMGR